MNVKKIILIASMLVLSQAAHAGGNAAAGADKAKVCAACHGADFNKPIAPDIPRLAGQHGDYLERALLDYKSGARKDPVMNGQAAALSKQDILDLAAYFHGLGGGSLHVISLHRFAGSN
jgi:cytochrome c553